MMSHNRLVFLASFAILAMAAVGLEVLLAGPGPAGGAGFGSRPRCWRRCACGVSIGPSSSRSQLTPQLGCGRPERVADRLGSRPRRGAAGFKLVCPALRRRRRAVRRGCFGLGAFCGRGGPGGPGCCPCWALLLVGDLLWFAYGRSAQCDPALYFPPSRSWNRLPSPPPAGLSASIVCRLRSPRCAACAISGDTMRLIRRA